VDDATPENQYYARMLPPRERPVEALGGVLNAAGLALGLCSIFIWPVFLGVPGVLLAGCSLPMSRSRATAQRFAWGFTIAVVSWMIGLIYASWHGSSLWP
jgi:hypothetical protein